MNPVDEYVKRLTGVHAPYNFTPLNEQVYQVSPEHARCVGHDLPFRDSVSGFIDIEICAVTPLCVGNAQHASDKDTRTPSRVEPLTLPNGRYGIAGSSLRGMIRSVVEIISFGRMQRFDDRHLSLRDLAGAVKEQYRERMTETRAGGFHPRVKAGWLEFNGLSEGWKIVPCQYARVPHQLLYDHSNEKWRAFESRSSAGDKYLQWQQADQPLTLSFEHEGLQKDESSGTWAVRCTALGRGPSRGTLVFTGQPGQYRISGTDQEKKNKKKVEFVFFDERPSDSMAVPEEVVRGFKAVHEDSDAWKFLKKDYQSMIPERHFRVPVFYLDESEGLPSAIGLALMFRLPYRNTIADAVTGPCPEHAGDKKDDLANMIFGHLSDEPGNSLKSRVSIGTAVCEQSDPALLTETVILSNPNPAFFPAYLEQPAAPDPKGSGRLSADKYTTYESDKPRIRGWKRYPARRELTPRALTDPKHQHMNTVLTLYPEGTKFRARIRGHNLRPTELGALAWAIQFGGEQALVHSLGMGKPYGYGQVLCRIRDSRLHDVNGERVNPQDMMDAFVAEMERWAEEHPASMPDGWLNSDRMRCFRAMCNPDCAQEWETQTKTSLVYLTTDQPGLSGNQMPSAHQKIKNEKLVLPRYLRAKPALTSNIAEDPEADQWLTEKIREIKEANNIRSEDEVWRGKNLAETISTIEDAERQRAVAQRVEAFWMMKKWWANPPSKKMKQARSIYRQILGEPE